MRSPSTGFATAKSPNNAEAAIFPNQAIGGNRKYLLRLQKVLIDEQLQKKSSFDFC
jgi:hypothetical protein